MVDRYRNVGQRCHCSSSSSTRRRRHHQLKYCLGVEHISVSDTVSDFGVMVDSHLSFSQHIEKITCKAHQRANLIHRCFVSKQRDLLVKAFITYAHLILEYSSLLWSPTLSLLSQCRENLLRGFLACQACRTTQG